jgi:hypothetical protein
MESTSTNTESDNYKFNHVMKFGLLAMLGYVVIFAIMRIMNLHYIAELRAVNYLIYFIIAFIAIKTFKAESNDRMSYLEGYLTGLFVAKVSFAFFALLMYVYLKFLDREFLFYLIEYSPMGIKLTPLSAALLIFFEGQAVGIVTPLILMQYFKKNINKISRKI